MSHLNISLTSVNSFLESVDTIRQELDKNQNNANMKVKVYSKATKDGFETYGSTKSKSGGFKNWCRGNANKQDTKTANAKAAFFQFMQEHGNKTLDSAQRMTASALIASIDTDPDNAFNHLQDLANLLEKTTGRQPTYRNNNDRRDPVDTNAERQQIEQQMNEKTEHLLNPKPKNGGKSIYDRVIPVASHSVKNDQPPQSNQPKSKAEVFTDKASNDMDVDEIDSEIPKLPSSTGAVARSKAFAAIPKEIKDLGVKIRDSSNGASFFYTQNMSVHN